MCKEAMPALVRHVSRYPASRDLPTPVSPRISIGPGAVVVVRPVTKLSSWARSAECLINTPSDQPDLLPRPLQCNGLRRLDPFGCRRPHRQNETVSPPHPGFARLPASGRRCRPKRRSTVQRIANHRVFPVVVRPEQPCKHVATGDAYASDKACCPGCILHPGRRSQRKVCIFFEGARLQPSSGQQDQPLVIISKFQPHPATSRNGLPQTA